jgi:hypothetical protein
MAADAEDHRERDSDTGPADDESFGALEERLDAVVGALEADPAAQARDQQAAEQDERRERHGRVGLDRGEDERQVDRGRQAGADAEGASAADRQLARRGDVGGEPPGEDTDDRTDDDRRNLGRGERVLDRPGSEDGHRDRGEERREREPDLELRDAGTTGAASRSSRSRPR